jgi:hypothetical protein
MPDKEPAALSDGRGPYIIFDQVGIDFKPAIAQIADAKGPLFITDIAWIILSFFVHPQLNAGM